jgi:N12 class adenine-specific DNA methylase
MAIRLGQLWNLPLSQVQRLGQLMIWTDEDEKKHPRRADGTFAPKNQGEAPAEKKTSPKPKPTNRGKLTSKQRFKAEDLYWAKMRDLPASKRRKVPIPTEEDLWKELDRVEKKSKRRQAVESLRAESGGLRPTEDEIEDRIAELSKPEKPAPKPEKDYSKGNWRYPSTDFIQTGAGGKPRFRENVAAIKLARQLEKEEREPSEEEKAVLSKFTGWGQFKSLFNTRDYDWRKERDELKTLISDEDFRLAQKSTRYSHFTAPEIVKAHWKMASKLGFRGGRYLEPAVGTGFYLGFMPESLAKKTQVTAVEMEPLSGGIAKALYPSANVDISPFQEHATPDNFYDLVATNVPFAKTKIYDPKYKRRASLHDYYFKRSVDTAKPGGLIMHITSTGTMDKMDPATRQYIDERCEFVSAIRFPGGVHQKSAKTQVVTDMLIFRKKHAGIPEVDETTPIEAVPKSPGFTGITVDSLGRLYHWKDGKRVPSPEWEAVENVQVGDETILLNEYFANNPEQMLGNLDTTGTMYGPEQMNVSMTEDYDSLLDAAIDRLPEGIIRSDEAEPTYKPEPEKVQTNEKYNAGQFVVRDGKVWQYDNGLLVDKELKGKKLKQTVGLIGLREKARAVLAAQRKGESGEAEQAALNEVYDAFVDSYGYVSKPDNRRLMKDEPDAEFLLALENWNSTDKTAEKADIFRKITIRPETRAESAANVTEGTAVSLRESSVIDPARIAELTGLDQETVESELVSKNLAFPDPNGGWEVASLYLSGETREKLKIAQAAAKLDPKYQANVDALEKNQPVDVDVDDIGIKLGSPWLPPQVLQDFAEHVTNNPSRSYSQKWDIQYVNVDVGTASGWQIRSNDRRNGQRSVWGVGDKDFVDLFKAAVTDRTLNVYSGEGSERRVNPELTAAAQEKIETIKDMFKEWVWEDDDRTTQLHRLYNDKQNTVVPINYDGSHLELPGLRDFYDPYSIQKDFIWRVISTGKGYAGHEVGTGKTLSMVASAMELRRLKLANKPCMSVKSSNVAQITAEAQEAYPNARILSMAGVKGPEARRTMLNRIATGDYDMVIMTHDNMDMLKMRPENRAKFIQEEMDAIEEAILAAAEEKGDDSARVVSRLESAKERLENNLAELMKEDRSDQIYFEDLGIDQVLIDEAHRYKSLPCYSSKGNIKGVPQTQSQRATRMLNKCRWLLDENNGRGVVMVSGTPVANTMAELYNVQRFLQFDDLKKRGVNRFDAWADQFGELTNRVEFKLDGELKETKRFAQFINLPELRHLASKVLDIKRAEDVFDSNGKPVIVDGKNRPNKHDVVHAAPETQEIRSMMLDIQRRAKAMKGKSRRAMTKGSDNMLNVCNDAKMGSMDLRMIDSNAPDDPSSKSNAAIRQAVKTYKEFPGTTQCMFTDLGINPTKKTGFSLVQDMKRKLIAAGIPENEIVHFTSGMNKAARQEAQAKMKRGEYRIAFGSTETLGTGTNIQKNLKAVHHLDIPYVPATLEQREGRAYRKGNQNKDVDVYKYVTEGSADNMFWQILATKKHFIDQFMLGKNGRSMTELDAEELTPEQMISIATGDPKMIERTQVTDELRKLKRSETRYRNDISRMRSKLEAAPEKRKNLVESRDKIQEDVKHAGSLGKFELSIGDRSFDNKADANDYWLQSIAKAESILSGWNGPDEVEVARYKGLPVIRRDVRYSGGEEYFVEFPSGTRYPAYGDSLDSIARSVSSVKKHADRAAERIDDHDREVSNIEKSLKRGFRGTDKMKELEKRLVYLKQATSKQEPIETIRYRDA